MYIKEYVVTVCGFDYSVTFSPHAFIRSRGRKVNKNNVIDLLKDASEVMGDVCKDNRKFVIKDIRNKIEIVAIFHFKAEWIDIITVWNGLDMRIGENQLVIEVTENDIKYYYFSIDKKQKS